MLRQVLVLTTASTGVSLSAVHTLGQIPSAVFMTPRSSLGAQGTYLMAVDNTHVTIANSANTNGQVDVTVVFWDGRRY